MNMQVKHGSRFPVSLRNIVPTPTSCVNCHSLQKHSSEHYNYLSYFNSDPLRSIGSLSAHSQCSNSSLGSSVDSRPGSCGDSQPGSSDESTVNQNSPLHRLNSSSSDGFRRFQKFEYTVSAPEMFANDQNNERQDYEIYEEILSDYEIHEDFNMNFIKKITVKVDNNFARQSHDLGNQNLNVQTDVSNNKSSAKKEDKIEQQSLVCEQTACISSGRWDLAGVSSTNMSGIEEHQSSNANTSQPIPLHSDKPHFCPQSLYCKTCSKYICEECAALCVCNHVTVEHIEFLDTVQQQVKDVLNEGSLGIDVLVDDIKEVTVS